MNNNSLISSLLGERNNFILIGLTGRTGSGCTTTAKLLNKPLEIPNENEVNYGRKSYFSEMDKKRFSIIRKYALKNNKSFKIIKVSELISARILALETSSISKFIASVVGQDLQKVDEMLNKININEIKSKFDSHKDEISYFLNGTTSTEHNLNKLKLDEWFLVVNDFTTKIKEILKSDLGNSYVKIYQCAGDSIRRTKFVDENYQSKAFDPEGLLALPRMINRLVKFHRFNDKKKGVQTYIAIDTIRNPYEAKYFKDRYSAFYLVSINAPSDDRKRYLQDKYKFTYDQIKDIDLKESGETKTNDAPKCNSCNKKSNEKGSSDKYYELIMPNVKRCIEISDIHIFNPRNESQNHNVLKAQLAWYLSLIKHPGLITPTSMERVMQIAYTAKMNSGCISRQVGAVVTDESFSIKSVGWNDVAKGQVPCNLRSLDELKSFSSDTTYSEYERNDEGFRKIAEDKLDKVKNLHDLGRNLSFCFKSIQNQLDNEKNQVHTRSLHAEENAFLQLAKYGGMGVERGKLFTTASPCELCAKKAYQLGIKEIVYIDPYPGLAIQHIISIGINPPLLIQFRGAVGKAYHQLYEPLMPYKDELNYLI